MQTSTSKPTGSSQPLCTLSQLPASSAGPPSAMHGVGVWPGQQLHGTPLCLHTPFSRPAAHRRRFAVFAADGQKETTTEEQPAVVRRRNKQQKQDANADFTLGDVNPISIGRKTRQVCAICLTLPWWHDGSKGAGWVSRSSMSDLSLSRN